MNSPTTIIANLLKRNLTIKIIALLLAVFLWLNVSMQKEYVATFSMPIVLVNIPKNLVVRSPFPNFAQVRVSGTGKRLIGMKLFSSPRVMVDIFRARVGKRTVVINNADVFLGQAEVRVVAIDEPQSIQIDFDRIRERPVVVQSRIQIVPQKGHIQVGQATVTPQRVVVQGPRHNISSLDTIYTASTVLEDLEKDTAAWIPLEKPEVFNVTCSTRAVKIQVSIDKVVERELRDVPVDLINVPSNVRASLDSSRVSLTISGAKRVVNGFTPNDLRMYVDYRKLTADSQGVQTPTIVTFKEVSASNLRPRVFRLVDHFKVRPDRAVR